MPVESATLKCLWRSKVDFSFNSVAVGYIFGNNYPELVVGHEDGVVRTYSLPGSMAQTQDGTKPSVLKCCSSLESKGGPIQVVALYDITRLHGVDITVADSRGMLTLFCHQQILNRKAVSEHCVQCLQVQKTASGDVSVITGDSKGHIAAFSPYADLWRLRLTDIKQLKGSISGIQVQSLLCVNLRNSQGGKTDYILATDNCKHLYFIHQGSVVLVLSTPVNITAMCVGRFVAAEDIETTSASDSTSNYSNPAFETQVALGSEVGAVYIMTNFEVYADEFANIKLPINQLQTVPAGDAQAIDTILCAGHFEGIFVLRDGKEVARHQSPGWVKSMVTADIDKDGVPEIVLGCSDNSIEAVKLGFS